MESTRGFLPYHRKVGKLMLSAVAKSFSLVGAMEKTTGDVVAISSPEKIIIISIKQYIY